MLLGVWGNMCCSLVTISQGDKPVGLVVLCGGGVVCVNCIVDACDFFFVHVLVFFDFLATVCVFCF